MPRKPQTKLSGEGRFLSALQGLIGVPKKELDAERDKYERRKAAKRAAAAKGRTKRRGS